MSDEEKQDLINRINSTSNANFVKRLLDPYRKVILNPDGTVSTHKLSWATDAKGNAIVYPEIQEINGQLVDLSNQRLKAYDSAIERGDTIQLNTNEAEWYTKNYKDYYPTFKQYKVGGTINYLDLFRI